MKKYQANQRRSYRDYIYSSDKFDNDSDRLEAAISQVDYLDERLGTAFRDLKTSEEYVAKLQGENMELKEQLGLVENRNARLSDELYDLKEGVI